MTHDVDTNLDPQHIEATRLFHSELDLVDLVVSGIARVVGSSVELDDLRAAGREGLFDAACRYDPTRGVPFRNYANIRVQGAVVDAVRRAGPLPRRVYKRLRALEAEALTAAGFSCSSSTQTRDLGELEESVADCARAMAASGAASLIAGKVGAVISQGETYVSGDPEDAAQFAELYAHLAEAVAKLNSDEATIIRYIYFDDLSYRQVAEKLDVSRSWVVRLHTRAMIRMTRYMLSRL
ncbi:MAG TPA: sigma-70 family RNA polymerase sigma factor [Polyangiaceae bacterium]|nr:sigma-70 family RNA polymerase sigma factor [Polyangiaceae bacterium]